MIVVPDLSLSAVIVEILSSYRMIRLTVTKIPRRDDEGHELRAFLALGASRFQVLTEKAIDLTIKITKF